MNPASHMTDSQRNVSRELAGYLSRHHIIDIMISAAGRGRMDLLREIDKNYALTAQNWRACECAALRQAAANGHMEVLDFLHEKGAARPDDCASTGHSMLRLAAIENNMEVLKWLAARGAATPEDCRAWDHNALIAAAARGHTEVLDWLERQGAATVEDCGVRDGRALVEAALQNRVEVLDWLERRGAATAADCRRTGAVEGWSPAILAARCGHLDVLRWLALRLPRGDLEAVGHGALWDQQRLQSFRTGAAIVVLTDRRRKRWRLPAELWDLIMEEFRGPG
jgi:hypothetical protein